MLLNVRVHDWEELGRICYILINILLTDITENRIYMYYSFENVVVFDLPASHVLLITSIYMIEHPQLFV